MSPLLEASAASIAKRVRAGELSARDVLEAHLEHVVAVNPTLNAVVAERFSEARAEAERIDSAVRKAELTADEVLAGVPCSIKECFAFTGMPQTSGLVSRKGVRADRDAPTVSRLRRAGAVPVGVTNVSELCMWMETSNRVYGRTNNPYDPSRIVGGSSGGDGAIVGAGGVPFGLGADIGGSIRLPAFFNGVFGHKATGGVVPNTGQFPLPGKGASRMLSTGPIARRAEDLLPLLKVLAGPDGEDSACEPVTFGDPAMVDLSKLVVVDVEGNGMLRASRSLRDAQRRAAEHLERLGARVVRRSFPLLTRSLEIWSARLAVSGGTPFAELLGGGTRVSPLGEFAKWSVGRSEHMLPAIMLAALENVADRMPAMNARALRLGEQLREEVVSALGDDAVMLYPSYTRPAPRHHTPLMLPVEWAYTAVLNALELPVTQVPLGLDDRGLPLGVQVVAAHHADHRTIAVALELERAFGGWVPPWRARERR